MAEVMTGFLRDAMRREFSWGGHDCALFCADRVLAVTGVDPARRWRGSYHSEAGARAVIEAAGGLVALFDQGIAGAGGLARCVSEAALIGVIVTEDGDTGAVRSGSSWVVLSERGLGRVRFDLVTCISAWGLSCPR